MKDTIKKFRLISPMILHGFDKKNPIQNAYLNDEIELIRSEWGDNFKNDQIDYFPLDLKNSDLWSTYDKSVDIDVFIDNNNFIASVDIYNGDNMTGKRTSLKWTAKFKLNENVILEYKSDINLLFEFYLDDLYDKELEEKREQRKKEIGNKLLNI